jgi:hypothetical protein
MDIDWADKNLLIGGKNPTPNEIQILSKINSSKEEEIISYLKQRIRESHNFILFTHPTNSEKRINYLALEKEPKSQIIDVIKNYSEEKRKFAWVLDKNPEKWRFTQEPPLYISNENPNQWKMDEFIREMSHWKLTPSSEDNDPINKHYTALALWLIFDEMQAGNLKDKMRDFLHNTSLKDVKPCRDLSLSRRLFAKQLYPLSRLAKRAMSEDHLWFCLEHSDFLKAFLSPSKNSSEQDTSKEYNRTLKAKRIKHFRLALKAGEPGIEYPQILTIDQLQKDGQDWRIWIEDLLLWDAIQLIWESNAEADITKDLKHYCHKLLDALAHHNSRTGHSKAYSHLVIKEEVEPDRRSRGRPAKGSNVKKC